MLGVLHKGQQVQGTNLDDLDEGTYYCTVGNTNSPADFCWVLTVFDRPSGTGDKSQLAWALNNIWVRRKSGTWGDWLKYNAVADFYKDYNSLASLANALGVTDIKIQPTSYSGGAGTIATLVALGEAKLQVEFGWSDAQSTYGRMQRCRFRVVNGTTEYEWHDISYT